MTDHRFFDDAHSQSMLPPAVLEKRQRAQEEAAALHTTRVYDVQWQVFHRLWRLSVSHSLQAWKHRYGRPLSAHALAFLYSQPVAGAEPDAIRQTEVVAATRLWLAGPESQNPLPLLSTLTSQVRGRDPREAWQVRGTIANRRDESMRDDATYLGLGMSSLDTHTGTFAQVCQSATSELDVPGVILYLASGSADPADQHVIVADRRGAAELNVPTIYSHRALSRFQFSSPYTFAEWPLERLYQNFGHDQLLQHMWHLDRAVREADHERLEAMHRARTRRRPT